MNTRRDFLKKLALLSSSTGLLGELPAAVQRAFAIDPAPGTTYQDAEHVVILMQENRSFDHAYGTLQGVRGFNDPRALKLPTGNPVWLQTNAEGKTYAPFRLNIKESKATWMGSLPHSWTNQVDARNNGKHDGWLEAKRSSHPDYTDLPLTLGYYTREDIPFYYALADAFTICDQHFCSSLTGTMPNRLYFWTGTVRGVHDASAPARVLNENVEYEGSVGWSTFPERLEEAGISWKVYQNELSLDVGLSNDEATWLSNFGDNPLEWFGQYGVRFLPGYRKELDAKLKVLPKQLEALETRLRALPQLSQEYLRAEMKRDETAALLDFVQKERSKYTEERFEQLSAREKKLHEKAFCTNHQDPAYHDLMTVRYRDGDQQRQMSIPKGDVLHQFRQDVQNRTLPTVSWIVAPEAFSDHPSSAWFGAWYVSEVMDILTQNPEVWRKTIFVLTYDENDGYFDHVPPFVAPHPEDASTGAVSADLNTREDFVTLREELKTKPSTVSRESSIGLGFRVPLVIASPWSRGGYVCSQVFDHTSMLQFLEKFLSHKSGHEIREANISGWRRAVCGDLTSVFRTYQGEKITLPAAVQKAPFLEQIHRSQFKAIPAVPQPLTSEQVAQIKAATPPASDVMPSQEPGTRASCPLPYELHAEGNLDRSRSVFQVTFAADNAVFGDSSAGAPFLVYAPGPHLARLNPKIPGRKWEKARSWSFAVSAGSRLSHEWPLQDFEDSSYFLRVYGPNGFFREFSGQISCPPIELKCAYERGAAGALTGNIGLTLSNPLPTGALSVEISDNAYHSPNQQLQIPAKTIRSLLLNLEKSSGWYDFTVRIGDRAFAWTYAGRVETGRISITDPAMART